jgi:23S rRNA (guanosine2251-2'-O)-methyltransferase
MPRISNYFSNLGAQKIKQEHENPTSSSIIYGRNPVLELLKSDKRTINKILISQTARGSAIAQIITLAKARAIAIHNAPPDKLDNFSENSQGVAAEVAAMDYVEIDLLIKNSLKNPKPLLVILDGITDPHNLGAIVRNCVVFGADGIIIPKWRAVAVNDTVAKASAGAIEHIAIARVSNTNQTIELLKKNGFWIAGSENGGAPLDKADLPFPLAIIIGSEGEGLHKLVAKNCDYIISIPQTTTISSLNASCAAAIFLYEVSKKR